MKVMNFVLSAILLSMSTLSLTVNAEGEHKRVAADSGLCYGINKDKDDNDVNLSKYNYALQVFDDNSINVVVQINRDLSPVSGMDFGTIYYNDILYDIEIENINKVEYKDVCTYYTNLCFDNENYPNLKGYDIRVLSTSLTKYFKAGDVLSITFTPKEDAVLNNGYMFKIFNTEITATPNENGEGLSYETKSITRTTLNDFDMNFDGKVNALDATLILRIAADIGAGVFTDTDSYLPFVE